MKAWTRREFGGLAGAALLAAIGHRMARSQAKARVVVIGGGVGGATVARYLAAGTEAIAVTLVEPKRRYITCFFSSLYLAGLRSLDSLSHGYETLAERGITVIHESGDSNRSGLRRPSVWRAAPGLPTTGWCLLRALPSNLAASTATTRRRPQIMPHAWIAGPQSELLRRQLESMEDGGVFVLVVPPDPFRCPPAPYERASLVAYYFKQHKPRAKILILDAKDSFKAQDLFEDAWARHYPGMIEWLPAQFTGGVKAVDVKARTVRTAGDTFKAAVANVIPAQMAGDLARQAGLANESGWCPVDPVTFESTLQPGIHLVGDAIIGGDMPKSAFSANSQAKACAFAVAAALTGSPLFPSHLFNSCYTFLVA